jgi:hypothetical protein
MLLVTLLQGAVLKVARLHLGLAIALRTTAQTIPCPSRMNTRMKICTRSLETPAKEELAELEVTFIRHTHQLTLNDL